MYSCRGSATNAPIAACSPRPESVRHFHRSWRHSRHPRMRQNPVVLRQDAQKRRSVQPRATLPGAQMMVIQAFSTKCPGHSPDDRIRTTSPNGRGDAVDTHPSGALAEVFSCQRSLSSPNELSAAFVRTPHANQSLTQTTRCRAPAPHTRQRRPEPYARHPRQIHSSRSCTPPCRV
jgi:hypothetical protein